MKKNRKPSWSVKQSAELYRVDDWSGGYFAIDDVEAAKFQNLLDGLFGFNNRLGNIVVVHNPGGRHDDKYIATIEYGT